MSDNTMNIQNMSMDMSAEKKRANTNQKFNNGISPY